jgi:hypothetical protein
VVRRDGLHAATAGLLRHRYTQLASRAGLKVADIAVVKQVTAGPTRVQLRLEAVNVMNWVNLGLPNASVLFNSDGIYRAGAARITTTATPARQLQLGVKVIF